GHGGAPAYPGGRGEVVPRQMPGSQVDLGHESTNIVTSKPNQKETTRCDSWRFTDRQKQGCRRQRRTWPRWESSLKRWPKPASSSPPRAANRARKVRGSGSPEASSA